MLRAGFKDASSRSRLLKVRLICVGVVRIVGLRVVRFVGSA